MKNLSKKYFFRFATGLKSSGGRNNQGKITIFHRGGGKKKVFRAIDFWRRLNSVGYVISIDSDPLRSAKIGLICYFNGTLAYIIATEGLSVFDRIFSGDLLENATHLYRDLSEERQDFEKKRFFFVGNALPLKFIPVGLTVSCVELSPYSGAQVCRSAGSGALLYKKSVDKAYLKLRSGWKIVVSNRCMATLGVVSNIVHHKVRLGKAGVSRQLGRRPVVRGVAMNPIDHPHGGGEGRSSGGPKPLSPWGKLTKWRPTVSGRKRLKLAKIRFK